MIDEFAHHVSKILRFILDILMPRNVEAQLEDDFAAVREVLRRRVGDLGEKR